MADLRYVRLAALRSINQVVGGLPQGFPTPTFPRVDLADLPLLAAAAVGMTLVAIDDTISTSAGFAARTGHDIDDNQVGGEDV